LIPLLNDETQERQSQDKTDLREITKKWEKQLNHEKVIKITSHIFL